MAAAASQRSYSVAKQSRCSLTVLYRLSSFVRDAAAYCRASLRCTPKAVVCQIPVANRAIIMIVTICIILACGDVDSWAPSSACGQGADIPLYFRAFLQLEVSEGRTQHESASASFGITPILRLSDRLLPSRVARWT